MLARNFLTGVREADRGRQGCDTTLSITFTLGTPPGGLPADFQENEQVTQTLKMCNLLPLFEVFTEEQEAIASFAKS